jgi:exopolyphosphatase/guanosine-5'-triphosphate,3'-diphosphate pyrophosphatase
MEKLRPLLEIVPRFKPHTLIGASGSFDTFHALIRNSSGIPADQHHGRKIAMRDYRKIHQALLRSTTEERRAMPGMEAVRVEMIVAATIFVSFVLRSCHINYLHHSEFALKEGVISELVGL